MFTSSTGLSKISTRFDQGFACRLKSGNGRRAMQILCSRGANRGNLRLYLDSASVYQWEKFAGKELFYGITSNPIILQKDEVPQCNLKVYKILAKQAFDLGYQEIQLQAWGRDLEALYAAATDIASIDSRVVVKIPTTEAGVAVAAKLKRQKALVNLTAMYSTHQVIAAASCGVDYATPYLHQMIDAGKKGFQDVLEMNDIVKGIDSSMKVLVAAVRQASDVATLAAQGCDTFTILPATGDEMLQDPQTAAAAADFEAAARSLGAY